jgi:glycosyltransferase involved in cell wall biosynthesis
VIFEGRQIRMTDPEPRTVKTVLVCKTDLLPYSETFIRNQVLAYRQWRGILVGACRKVPGLSLEDLQVLLLRSSGGPLNGKSFKLFSALRIPPPGVIRQLRSVGAALIHVHFATEAVAFWPIISRLSLPVVITLHGHDINVYREFWDRKPLYSPSHYYPHRLVSIAKRPNVHFVAVSEAIKRRAIEFGLPADKISVSYIGIDLKAFHGGPRKITDRPRRVLYIGRFVEKKGGQYLVQAFARVKAQVPDAELFMIGDGPLLESCKRLASQSNTPVTFTGSLDSKAVRAILDETRVLCAPSVTTSIGDAEGLPIAVLEAQACGIPVVTSARGGATEGIKDRVSGFAFAEADVDTLSQRLAQVLQDDPLASRMSSAASAHAKDNFDIQKCTGNLEALYDRVCRVC